MRAFLACVLIASWAYGATPSADKVSSKADRKAEHESGKIVVKVKAKDGKSWKTEREFPLMFKNNVLAKKQGSK